MRIEKGFAAMGHELDGDLTPVEAGMDGMLRAGGFIGAEAVDARRRTARRSLVTVLLEEADAVPLGHEPILMQGGIIGQTSSAAYGYRVGCPVALGHVSRIEEGGGVEVNIAGRLVPGRMQTAPAFDPTGKRMRG